MSCEPDNPLPAGTHIGRTALSVSSLEDMKPFYQQVAGLRLRSETSDTARLGTEETELLVLQLDEKAQSRPRSSAGFYHNAFRVPSQEALGDALGRIRQHWELDGASDHTVSEALYLTDPDGNGVEIYRDLPRESWPMTDTGLVDMGTAPLDLDHLETAASGQSTVLPGTDVGHIHLEVSSLDAFTDYYIDTLGFTPSAQIPAASFVAAGGYHHHIGANTWNRRTTAHEGRGLAWFELVVPDSDALEALCDRVAAKGHSLTRTDAGVELTDPDGISIRIRAPEATGPW